MRSANLILSIRQPIRGVNFRPNRIRQASSIRDEPLRSDGLTIDRTDITIDRTDIRIDQTLL